MSCQKLQNKIFESFGFLDLDEEEMAHINKCESCRQVFEELNQLESLIDQPAPQMTAVEFAQVQEKLDLQISGYRNKAFGLYNWMIRYGVSAAALFIVFAISMISSIEPIVTVDSENYATISDSYYVIDYISSDEIDLDENYYNLVADEYQENYGATSIDQLLGDINNSEYEYLIENINVGDML